MWKTADYQAIVFNFGRNVQPESYIGTSSYRSIVPDFKQKPIIPSFAVGIFLGVVFAMIFQDCTLVDVLTALNKGYTQTRGCYSRYYDLQRRHRQYAQLSSL